MDQLWAPWRQSYVTKPKPPTATDECFVCRAIASTNDRQNLLAKRTAHGAILLNLYPYNNGHLLVCPNTHKANLDDLTIDEYQDLMDTVRLCVRTLTELMKPDGFNVGINLGRAAGAGLPGHLHWHVVPRWNGDANFMPVVADTRVIIQSLDSLYDLLESKWGQHSE